MTLTSATVQPSNRSGQPVDSSVRLPLHPETLLPERNDVSLHSPAPEQVQTEDLRVLPKPRRNRKSAKQAGASFERTFADWLSARLEDDRIDRRVKRGNLDRGDIGGVRLLRGGEVTIEAKNYGGEFKVGPWLAEVETERGNADGAIGVVVAKRRGITDPAQQVVFMTAETLAVLIEGGVDL